MLIILNGQEGVNMSSTEEEDKKGQSIKDLPSILGVCQLRKEEIEEYRQQVESENT